MWELIWTLYGPHLPSVAFAFAMGALGAVAHGMLPLVTADILSSLSDWERMQTLVARYMALSMMATVCTALRGRAFTRLGERAFVRLSLDACQRLILEQPYAYFQQQGDAAAAADVPRLLTEDVGRVSEQLSMQLNVVVRSCVQMGIMLGILVQGSWLLTLFVLVSAPLGWLTHHRVHASLNAIREQNQVHLRAAHDVTNEAIAHMAVVKCFGIEAHVERRFRTHMADFYAGTARHARAYFQMTLATTVFPLAVVCGMLWGGLHLMRAGRLASRDLVLFYMYHASVADVFRSLMDIVQGIQDTRRRSKKLLQLLKQMPLPSSLCGGAAAAAQAMDVTFQDVSFTYPSAAAARRPALSHATFHIPAGQHVALVGKSGSGKSTAVKLLMRLYAPSQGQICLDGVPLDALDPTWFYRHISIVMQEPVLFKGTLRENIAFGLTPADNADDNAIWEACRQADAAAFVQALPKGLDTPVGGAADGCSGLSGGQKQRIALARALLRAPKLLVLDEATSALDMQSEAEVQKALRALMRDRSMTILTIAHRPSTLELCERFLTFDEGCVRS